MSLALFAAAAGASALFGGLSASRKASLSNQNLLNNASYRAAATRYNADLNFSNAMFSSASIGSQARQNTVIQSLTSKRNAEQKKAAFRFNTQTILAAHEFNMDALSEILPELLTQHELDSYYLQQNSARTEGTIQANQAASGTVLNEGSNAAVITDIRTQTALEQTVLNYNLHTKQKSIYDAMAKGTFETQQAINALAFETNNDLLNIKSSSTLNAYATLSSAFNRQQTILFDAYTSHRSAYFNADMGLEAARASTVSPTEAGLTAAGKSLISSASTYYGSKL